MEHLVDPMHGSGERRFEVGKHLQRAGRFQLRREQDVDPSRQLLSRKGLFPVEEAQHLAVLRVLGGSVRGGTGRWPKEQPKPGF
jgi:hypothetical protein